MKGIDISVHNGTIDFTKVKKSGIDFVIIRAGYGLGTKDKNFEANYEGAINAGLHVGFYWYSYAKKVDEAIQEAKSFYNFIKDKPCDMPVFYDIEEATSRPACNDLINAFCSYMESQNYFVGVYANKDWFTNYINSTNKEKYTTWIAQWSSKCTYTGNYTIWQYTDSGKVDGIQGNVDMDESYVDFSSIILSRGFNGNKTETTEPVSTPDKIKLMVNDKIIYEGEYSK